MPSDDYPLFFSSAVLADARVIVEGGEDNTCFNYLSNLGAIYDPVTNAWTPVNPPSGWSQIGDAPATLLSDGTYMQGNYSNLDALLNVSNLTWSGTGAGKFDFNQEVGWTLLPNGIVLTVVTYHDSPLPFGTNSEI